MKAIGIAGNCAEHGASALINLDIVPPEPEARDILVRVAAVSVNPLDIKMRDARHGYSIFAPDDTTILDQRAISSSICVANSFGVEPTSV